MRQVLLITAASVILALADGGHRARHWWERSLHRPAGRVAGLFHALINGGNAGRNGRPVPTLGASTGEGKADAQA